MMYNRGIKNGQTRRKEQWGEKDKIEETDMKERKKCKEQEDTTLCALYKVP